jgi:hypothetical protein
MRAGWPKHAILGVEDPKGEKPTWRLLRSQRLWQDELSMLIPPAGFDG